MQSSTGLGRKSRRIVGALLLFIWVVGLAPCGWTGEADSTPSTVPAEPTARPAAAQRAALDVMDQRTQSLVNSVSKVVHVTRHSLVDRLGGQDSFLGGLVDRTLTLFVGEVANRPVWLYLFSLVILLAALFLRHMIARRISLALKSVTARTKTTLDEELVDALVPCLRLAVALVGTYIAVQVFFAAQPIPEPPLTPSDRFRILFRMLIYLSLLGTLAWALVRAADVFIQGLTRWTEARGHAIDATFVPIGRRAVKVFLVAVVVLQALDYLEFDTVVKSLLGVAGLSGLAIGLAAQDTLKNLFGSLVLMFDRPFSVGELVSAGAVEGTVETVGLRSSRVRTYEKTLVTVPNSSIVDRDIDNLARRPVRRVKMMVGVTYSTQPGQMEALLVRIKERLRNDPAIWQEFMIIRFTEFGDSSLNILLQYYTVSTVYDEHLEVRERINLSIMRILDEMGLEIAFPTRTVHLAGSDDLNERPLSG